MPVSPPVMWRAAASRPSGEASPSLMRSFSPGPGLEEAKDVSLHLQPLRILLEEMEQVDYSQVNYMWQNNQAPPGFLVQVEEVALSPRGCVQVRIHPGSARPSLARPRPCANKALLPQLQPYMDRALCTVRLLRAHCQHYSSPARVIVVLQEICNLLMEMVESRARRWLQRDRGRAAPSHHLLQPPRCGTVNRRGDTGQAWGAQLGSHRDIPIKGPAKPAHRAGGGLGQAWAAGNHQRARGAGRGQEKPPCSPLPTAPACVCLS